MTADAPQKTRAIIVEEVLPHSAEIVWKVLTTRELMARWLMDNDFEPGVGRSFTMRSQPIAEWDGTVACTILTFDPPRQLSYSWVGGYLDSTVTWTLTPVEGGGTRLRMVHDGFVSPRNDMGYDMMSGGWKSVVGRIGEIAGEQG